MKIAIVGSREYLRWDIVHAFVSAIWRKHPGATVLSGGARGVDRHAVQAAMRHHMAFEVYPAQWDRYGKRAGYLRNELIVADADQVVAFWDGKSRGTKHTIDIARRHGVPFHVYGPNGKPLDPFRATNGTPAPEPPPPAIMGKKGRGSSRRRAIR